MALQLCRIYHWICNASFSWLLIFYIDLSIPTISELITPQISYCLRVGSIFLSLIKLNIRHIEYPVTKRMNRR